MSETVGITPGLPSHIRPGVVIGGKYRLELEIGKGSMGTVYRAVHVTLGQRVAIKLISTEHLQSTEARRRFSVEAKAVAKLRSSHVVQVYDDGETPEGNPYIVLEYLEGETLEQRLERERDVPLLEAVRITNHVGRALARAHAQGIVHRDLKPANIFLVKTDDEELGWIAKVLDFGIAKLESAEEKGTTQAGTVLGTPLFMSPEQVRGASSVDHRADLYSLGMCLYNMLTGEFAFASATYSDILIAICTDALPSLRATAPWLPAGLDVWFQRACARDRMDRFQSADEMTEALSAAAGTAPQRSKHKSFPDGRIAPETLIGYAPPAFSAGPFESSAARQSATQLARPSQDEQWKVAVGSATLPLAASSSPSGRHTSHGGEPLRFGPLWVGGAIGLAALLAVGVAALLAGGSQDSSAEPQPSSAPAAAPLPPHREVPPPAPPPTPLPPDPLPSSSPTGAESLGTTAGTAKAPEPGTRAPVPLTRPAKRPEISGIPGESAPKTRTEKARPSLPKSAGSDLGF